MSASYLLSLGVLCLFGCTQAAPLQYSETRFDGLDLSSILNNDELYIQLFQCLIGRGKCTPDWELLKDAVPGALLDDCVDCSEKQKIGTKTLLAHLIHHKQEDMRHLEGEFDPDASYRKALEKSEKEEEEKQTNVIQTKRAAQQKDVEFIRKVKRIK